MYMQRTQKGFCTKYNSTIDSRYRTKDQQGQNGGSQETRSEIRCMRYCYHIKYSKVPM